MFYTHLLFSLLIGQLSSHYLGVQHQIVFIAVVCLFGILPDIDSHNSKVGKKIPLLSFMLNVFVGHRGVFHSLFIPIILYLIILFLDYPSIALALFIGYTSHLALDACTDSGVQLFWPFKYKIKGFIKTDSIREKILFLVLLTLNVYVFLHIITQ